MTLRLSAYYDRTYLLFQKTENEYGAAQVNLGRGKSLLMSEKKI